MRILAIRGKNLASLAGAFEIDFQAEPLVNAGLFAITGATGAGKSTLLDALCLALYERTPRLLRASSKGEVMPDVGDNEVSPSDPRTILRRGAAEGHAEVDFVGSDGLSYRARWSVRRSRNKSDGRLQASEVGLLRLVDSQVLSDSRKTETLRLIEARIGLNFDQFTRAVLLAQNEFAAFLRASDDERAELQQTLTGTETFTRISQDAYARMKVEKEQLDRLQTQLLDQAPLTQQLRGEKNAQLLAQAEKVGLLEARKALEEAQLRWFKQLDELSAAESDASRKLDTAKAEQLAAAPRHSQLSTQQRVQSARPLCVELDRLGTELADIKQTLAIGMAAREASAITLRTCADDQQAAAQALGLADAAKQQAQPLIDRARELDAKVSALQPGWQGAITARDSAQAQLNLNDGRKAEAGKRLASSRVSLTDASTWLSTHDALCMLAPSWPRWETLFGNARDHLTAHDRAASDAKALNIEATTIAETMAQQQAAVAAATATLSAAQQNLASHTLDCAALDPEKLAQDKQRAAARGEHLQAAALLWQQIGDGLQQRSKQAQQLQVQHQLVQQCDLALQAGAARQPLLERDLSAAQRSLERATLAAGKDAKSLRAGLQTGNPCPVCGAVDHPYAAASPQSDAILGALKAQVSEQQQALNALLQDLAAATARSQSAAGQVEALTGELASLAQADASRRHAWAALALQAEWSAVAEADQTRWLADQQARVKADMARLTIDERSYRDKLKQKELAQGAMAPAQSAVDAARQALDKARLQQQLTGQAIAVQHKKVAEQAAQLAGVLRTLDGAFADASWRDNWLAQPQAFVSACGAQARQWLLKHQQVQDLSSQINTQQSEFDGCDKACQQATAQRNGQAAMLAGLGNEIQAWRDERRKIFDGRPTSELESGLNGPIEQAKAGQLKAQSAWHSAQTENARLAESVKLTTAGLTTGLQRQATAAEQLDGWMAAFSSAAGAAAGSAPLLPADLRQLLATPEDWLVQEREALQAMVRGVASGQAVLEEHRSAKLKHEAGKTVLQDADALRAEQAITVAALAEAAPLLTGLKIETAQDDEKLGKSLVLREQIDQQTSCSRVWSQLSEIIGSADGKKFRNFAQQLTLDILLRDANLHLQSLSRRYRLERITDSLGLLVVDQDMGDERRSVHSLSGGESFLVSLALALGLASLSSNRVRVESLFIDEGFGSLDADSLRVAMDALDNLQALGRKVGVISHVQEMTERIGTRINVRRMAGGQSKVTVS